MSARRPDCCHAAATSCRRSCTRPSQCSCVCAGDRVVTELQSASLTATAPEDVAAAKFSGAYNRATAESVDNPALSATADLGLASNTDVLLTAASTANRYGYTQARPLARVRVSDGLECGRLAGMTPADARC